MGQNPEVFAMRITCGQFCSLACFAIRRPRVIPGEASTALAAEKRDDWSAISHGALSVGKAMPEEFANTDRLTLVLPHCAGAAPGVASNLVLENTKHQRVVFYAGHECHRR